MGKEFSRLAKFREQILAIVEERNLPSEAGSMLHRFVHFWVLVWRSFNRNRCLVRASALAYATLLALIPMLAVVIGVTSTFLKQEGEDQIDQFIVKLVASVTPAALINTNLPAVSVHPDAQWPPPDFTGLSATNAPPATAAAAAELPALAKEPEGIRARKEASRAIHEFIQNTRSGTLGVTGAILLIFAAISMLSRIEDTFNDIWGVARGRNWFMRFVLYWGVLTLAPLLLVGALGLATGPHLEGTREFLNSMPFIGYLTFQMLPLLVLCLTFSAFYLLVPNTKVNISAALVGGFVGGGLLHINNLLNVLYVSRVISYSKIYGSIGLIPVFMIGLYFTWLILLFGAQVAYAFQNRATYVEEKQIENINQRGREFVALRLLTHVGQRFLRGLPPATDLDLAHELAVPTRLIRQIMQTLSSARLVVETARPETGYLPARPMETITCHDVLQAMRASHGQELSTRDEPTRSEVLGEFSRIQAAERQAASSVTLLALATRAQSQLNQAQLVSPDPDDQTLSS